MKNILILLSLFALPKLATSQQIVLGSAQIEAEDQISLDTTKGVVVWYDDALQIRADSALLIRQSGGTYWSGDGSGSLVAVKKTMWFERSIFLTKHGHDLPKGRKISFHPIKDQKQ